MKYFERNSKSLIYKLTILKYFKYRKIRKEIIKFLDYEDIFYGSTILLIQCNNINEHNYYKWGEIDYNLIRIRRFNDLKQINNDLKKYYNQNRYRKAKFKRLIK